MEERQMDKGMEVDKRRKREVKRAKITKGIEVETRRIGGKDSW